MPPGQQRVLYFVVHGEYNEQQHKLSSRGRLQGLATAQILGSRGLDPTSIRVTDTGGAVETAIFIIRYFITSFIECVKPLRNIRFNERGEVAVSKLLSINMVDSYNMTDDTYWYYIVIYMIQNQRHERRAAEAFHAYIQNVDGLLAPTQEVYICHSSMAKYLLARLVYMQHNETIGINYALFPSYSRLQNQPFRASPNYDHCSITKAVIEADGTVFLECENNTDHLTNL